YVTPENRRAATNAGETRHRGIEVSAGAMLPAWLRLDASYSVGTQRYVTWVPQAARPATGTQPGIPEVRYDGHDVEAAPRDLASVSLQWAPPALRDGRIGLAWAHTGSYAMDAANTPGQRYPGYELLSANASYQLRPELELFARATNLLDEKYAELAAYDPFQRATYTPGTPRMVVAGVRLAWER
ncbi:MAG TPA: TonB-dependent receptor, partial [Gemmatimonadaceae bacterium]|nr:TonB-dependent receptor [Gemmatimonadaceae bacterium]